MNTILLLSFFYLIFFSIIGWGILLIKIIDNKINTNNIGLIGLVGLFSLTLISYFTHLFTPHNYLHNLIVISIGLVSLIFFFKKNFLKKNLLISLFISVVLISGFFVEKNHDDFPFYHLQYSLQLVDSKISFGLGNLTHGWRHHSSIFFLNSIFYLPYIKYYLFHISGFLTLIFVNSFIIFNLINSLSKKNFNSTEIFYLIVLVYINSKFYNIGNYGTDISGQIIILILIPAFFEFLRKNIINQNLKIYLVLFLYLVTLKVFFLIYFIFPLIYLINNFKNKKIINIYFKSRLFILGSVTFLFLFFYNFAFTGCFLYPIQQTCLENKASWSLNKTEVKRMKTYIEGWSKAGVTTDYVKITNLSEYNSKLNWVSGWVDRYFFNKGLENFLAIIFLCILFIALLKKIQLDKQSKKQNIIYLILFFIFFEWFYNHPQLRYGGYSAVAIFLFSLTSSLFKNKNFSKVKKIKIIFIFIMISGLIYNSRNYVRIYEHFDNKQFLNFPYFHVQKGEYKRVEVGKNIKITISSYGCWDVPVPCGTEGKRAINKNGYIIYFND